MNSTAPKQLFSVVEANKRLPLVKAIVKDIVSLAASVEDRTERLTRLGEGRSERDENIYSEELEQSEDALRKDSEQLEEFIEELHKLGVELEDPVRGQVHFRSQLEGREVVLCWKPGDDEVAFWNELDAQFDQRQSLLEGTTFGETSTDSDSDNN